MVRKLVPDSRRCTANACRRECGVTGLERPDNRCAFWQGYGVLRDWPIIVNARERPLLRAKGDPIAAQDLRQHGRQQQVPIFATFTLLDANNHTGIIDGGGSSAGRPPKCKPAASQVARITRCLLQSK